MTQQKDSKTSQSLHRQWKILSFLPNGKWIGTRELQTDLQKEGIDVSLRTIQRDLNQLAERFPIESNQNNPQGWRWQHNAPIQSLPHMSSSQAVTFMMVEEHLQHLLPPSLLAEIQPWFELARKNLQHQTQSSQWLNKVKIIPATQPLIPPSIDADAQHAIYEAVLQQKVLRADYCSRHSQQLKSYTLNPVALVQRGAVIYLICTRHDGDPNQILTFALHRFQSADVLDLPANLPKNFDLDTYIESGTLGFRLSMEIPTDLIDVRLRLHERDATSFYESQLAKNQQIVVLSDGNVDVTATVPFNSQLVWWLRGFGRKIIDIQPQSLADAVWERESQ